MSVWGSNAGGPANPGYNPWNYNTHRIGYTENVQDYDEWERQHRNDEAETEELVWVREHKRKRGRK